VIIPPNGAPLSPFPSPVITVHDIGTENPPASGFEEHGSQSSELEAPTPNHTRVNGQTTPSSNSSFRNFIGSLPPGVPLGSRSFEASSSQQYPDPLRGLREELVHELQQTRRSEGPRRHDLPGELPAHSSIQLSDRAPSIQESAQSIPISQFARTHGNQARAGARQAQPEVDDTPSPQPSVHAEQLRCPLRDSHVLLAMDGVHRLGFDIDIDDLPISLRLESTCGISRVSFLPGDTKSAFHIILSN